MSDAPITMPSVPKMTANTDGPIEHLNAFLDQHVLPYPVKYLTNRVTIIATLCLLVPLIAFATNQVFVLLANSYLNVMSVVVSSTVLLYSTLADLRAKQAAEQRELIAQRHEKMVDQRAQEDHQKIVEIHSHLDEIQKILVERLEKLQGEDHTHIEETQKAVMASVASHHEELQDLRKLVETLSKGSK